MCEFANRWNRWFLRSPYWIENSFLFIYFCVSESLFYSNLTDRYLFLSISIQSAAVFRELKVYSYYSHVKMIMKAEIYVG